MSTLTINMNSPLASANVTSSVPSLLTVSSVVAFSMAPLAEEKRCRYPSKRCEQHRALKRNGELHNFCDFHRSKANRNQRRLERKRKLQKMGVAAPSVETSVSTAGSVKKSPRNATKLLKATGKAPSSALGPLLTVVPKIPVEMKVEPPSSSQAPGPVAVSSPLCSSPTGPIGSPSSCEEDSFLTSGLASGSLLFGGDAHEENTFDLVDLDSFDFGPSDYPLFHEEDAKYSTNASLLSLEEFVGYSDLTVDPSTVFDDLSGL